MSKSEVRTAVKQTIGRSIRYPLAATTMNKEDCKEIQVPFTKYSMAKIGVVQTELMPIATAPMKYGGLGLANIYENQMINHLHIMMQHGHMSTVTRRLLRITLENLSLKSGGEGDLIRIDVRGMRWITQNTRLGNVSHAIKEHSVTLRTPLQGLQKWTSDDNMIMDDIQLYCHGNNMDRFNKVRMYLAVTTVAELLTADLPMVDTTILKGERAEDYRTIARNTNGHTFQNQPGWRKNMDRNYL